MLIEAAAAREFGKACVSCLLSSGYAEQIAQRPEYSGLVL